MENENRTAFIIRETTFLRNSEFGFSLCIFPQQYKAHSLFQKARKEKMLPNLYVK